MKNTPLLLLLLFYHWGAAQLPNDKIIHAQLEAISENMTASDSIELLSYKKLFEKEHRLTDTLYAQVLYLSGLILQNKKEYLRSNLLLEQAQKIYHSESIHRIFCQSKIADNCLELNEANKALLMYEQVIQQGMSYKAVWTLVANAYKNIANISYRQGDFEKSIQQSILGENWGKKAKNNKAIAHNLRERSKALNALGNIQAAEKAINYAIELLSKNEISDDLAAVFQAKGFINLNQKEYANALFNFKKASQIYLALANYDRYSLTCIDIGFLYYDPYFDYKNALIYYNEALKYPNRPFVKVQANDNIGAVYWKQKDYKKALQYYQSAFCTNDFFKFSNYSIESLPQPKLLKYADFKRTFLIVLQDKALCWLDYYKATKNQSHLKNALNTYLLADKLIDFMRWEHKGTQSKLFWRNKTRSIYENAIETCYLLKDYEKAFYFFEKSRAVMLNDKLNELGAKQILSEADRAKEIQLQSRIDELRKKSETDKTKIDQTERELLMAENAQNDFIKNLEKTNPAYYNFKYNTKTDSLKQVQQYLKSKGSTLIEYFVGDSLTYVIVVSPTAVKIQTLRFDPNDTQTYLRLCAKAISTKTELNEFLAVSHRLYRNLIAPLNLSKGHLIISQDGAFLPFEALSLSASKPKNYLLHEQAVSYTYSAQFLLKNQPSSHFWPQKSFLGVAPVQFSQKLNTLTGSAESIGRIGGSYLWKNELVHQKATKNAFLSQASGHRIVQVYTHAFADSTQTEPHIYFADSALKVSDLGNASFKIDLLVLSACKTGVGKVAKGEGVLSLARGFSMAGIPSTITTLWSVEDQTTYSLTELFYTFLNKGFSKDEALQEAKRQYLSTHPNAAPSAWAGLVLIGDAAALPSNTLWWWGLGGLAVLLILGGIRMKRNFSVQH